MMRLAQSALLALCLIAALPARAVLPDEVLADPALEARARHLSAQLRCMVCQNQSIDESDADLARDLRFLVRERLTAGDTDAEVLGYLVSRYGEFVLLKPRLSWENALLWAAPALLIGCGTTFLLFRLRRTPPPIAAALTEEEGRRLEAILRSDAP